MNMAEFAEAAGISQQLLYHYFTVKDDMSLYTAKNLLKKTGMELIPGIESKTGESAETFEIHSEDFSIEGDLPIKKKSRTPKYIKESAAGDKRLSFLAREIEKTGKSEAELCERLGVKRGLLMYVFEGDDIRISMLYSFARALGKKVVWRIKNSPNDTIALSPEQHAEEKVKELLGPVDIVKITHTKGNRFRITVSLLGEVEVNKKKGLKVHSVNPLENTITIDLAI